MLNVHDPDIPKSPSVIVSFAGMPLPIITGTKGVNVKSELVPQSPSADTELAVSKMTLNSSSKEISVAENDELEFVIVNSKVTSAPAPTGSLRKVLVKIGSGFLARSSTVLHFGLGDEDTVERIEIHWPSGRVEEYTKVAARQRVRFREGDSSLD